MFYQAVTSTATNTVTLLKKSKAITGIVFGSVLFSAQSFAAPVATFDVTLRANLGGDISFINDVVDLLEGSGLLDVLPVPIGDITNLDEFNLVADGVGTAVLDQTGNIGTLSFSAPTNVGEQFFIEFQPFPFLPPVEVPVASINADVDIDGDLSGILTGNSLLTLPGVGGDAVTISNCSDGGGSLGGGIIGLPLCGVLGPILPLTIPLPISIPNPIVFDLSDGGETFLGFAPLDLAGLSVGASLTLTTTSAVPVPAAAWLFGSALMGLVFTRRKQLS